MIAQQAANRSLCMLLLGSRQGSMSGPESAQQHKKRAAGRYIASISMLNGMVPPQWRISAALRKPGVESKRRVPMQWYVRTAY